MRAGGLTAHALTSLPQGDGFTITQVIYMSFRGVFRYETGSQTYLRRETEERTRCYYKEHRPVTRGRESSPIAAV